MRAAPAVGLLLAAGVASAEEPKKVTEPPVMREAAEITSVVDAFDDEDSFDLHITLGFQQTWKSGNILRENATDLDQFSSGGYTAGNMNVAKYSETTSRLNTRADIGLYKDIGLVLRLPIILSNDRKLEDLDGSQASQSIAAAGAPGETLFQLPFDSPTRSGIEYLAVGADFGLMNQSRDLTKPTWVFGLEGRFNVSEPLHACRENTNTPNPGIVPAPGGPPLADGQEKCANPADINRDGQPGQYLDTTGTQDVTLEGTNFQGGRDAGVSRGTTGLQLHTYLSKRIKYIEPFGGFEALFEFQNSNSDYGQTDLQGSLVNHPPFQGSMVAGIAVMPWEIRDQFQRIELDFWFKGTYRSEGRDYSPLFDALGSTDAPSLRRPNFAEFQQNVTATGCGDNDPDTSCIPSVVNPNSQKVYFTGITDVQQHGIYEFAAQFVFQAGEYVKFNLGGSFTARQGHIITFDQPCNPDLKKEIGKMGPCRAQLAVGADDFDEFAATGIPNPNYRPPVNAAGRRFRLDDSTQFDAWLNAIVMF